jgi:hypothetical protein
MVSALSVPSTGRNRKYMFALAPRFNYADVAGVEEVDEMLRGEPFHAF